MSPCIDCGVPGRTVLCAPCKSDRRQLLPSPVNLRALIRSA